MLLFAAAEIGAAFFLIGRGGPLFFELFALGFDDLCRGPDAVREGLSTFFLLDRPGGPRFFDPTGQSGVAGL